MFIITPHLPCLWLLTGEACLVNGDIIPPFPEGDTLLEGAIAEILFF